MGSERCNYEENHILKEILAHNIDHIKIFGKGILYLKKDFSVNE